MPFDDDLGGKLLEHRIAVERDLGLRSFYDFYLMAWPVMDPEPFVPGKHIRVISYHLQLAARREIKRLVICIPPRYSKSLLSSVAFPAWVWTWWPSAKFITCSYDQKLATRDSLATRRLVESPWYQSRWPEVRFERDQHQKMWYQTTAGGVRYVGSPSSGVTGHGSDFNLFDDPHNIVQGESDADREQARVFWFESMSSRFNNPAQGVSLVIQQRVHQSDVAGECIRRGYHHVILPARFEHNHPEKHAYDWRKVDGEPLWPEKFTDHVLTGLWTTLKDYATAGQQQQRPTSREGGLFKREWFEVVDTLPDGLVWVRAWDFAGTEKTMKSDPDWTANCKIGINPKTKVVYIANVARDRQDPGGVEQMMKATANQDGKNIRIFIPQDPGQAGKPIWIEELVLLANGQRLELKSIQVGDCVINKDGNPTAVEAVHEQGNQACVRLVTASGREVTAALDHPFLTPDGWREARDLRVGSVLGLRSRPRTEAVAQRAEHEFALAGYFIGDGSVGIKNGASSADAGFECHDEVQLADFCRCVNLTGGTVVSREHHGRGPGNPHKKGRWGTKGLQPWLRATDLAGKTAYTKRVPAWVFGGSPGQIAAFLGAYFACDGWLSKDREAIFYSVSKGLLEDVQHLLLRLGINATLKVKNGKYLKSRHRSWLLRLRQQDDAHGRFLYRVPIAHSTKTATFSQIVAEARFRRFDEEHLPDPIVAIEDAGELPCRCLTVKSGASFTVQDLVVHNSQVHYYVTQVLQGYMVSSEIMSQNKRDRADPLAAQAKVGNVKLYRANWNADFLEELTSFPAGSHDDQVDAAASGYNQLIHGNTGLLDFMRQQQDKRTAEEDAARKAMGLQQHRDYERVM